MWLCADADVNINSNIQHPFTIGYLVKGGADQPEARADEWGGSGTAPTMAGLRGGSTGTKLVEFDVTYL